VLGVVLGGIGSAFFSSIFFFSTFFFLSFILLLISGFIISFLGGSIFLGSGFFSSLGAGGVISFFTTTVSFLITGLFIFTDIGALLPSRWGSRGDCRRADREAGSRLRLRLFRIYLFYS
jgi:hypothetical protein